MPAGLRPIEVSIIPMGNTNLSELSFLPERFSKIFRVVSFKTGSNIKLPSYSYDSFRRQYNSTILLEYLATVKPKSYARFLGIVDVDLYARDLNFVFGEAVKGGDAIISTSRLRPEFYGDPPDRKLFEARVLKEAVHELSHTFGLTHCKDPRCVMHFSNSIMDTDFKRVQPCNGCHAKLLTKLISAY